MKASRYIKLCFTVLKSVYEWQQETEALKQLENEKNSSNGTSDIGNVNSFSGSNDNRQESDRNGQRKVRA